MKSRSALLISALEEERSRIARELHDDTSQKLALLAMEMHKLHERIPPSGSWLQAELSRLHRKLTEAADDIQKISHRLHPSIVGDLGLAAAIRAECGNISVLHDIDVKFTSRCKTKDVSLQTLVALYRIAQEGLRNVVKHAHSAQALLTLERLKGPPGSIRLRIKDSGRGFDPVRVKDEPSLGLTSMRERAGMVQGVFTIKSSPGRGTVLEVLVPTKLV